MLPTTTKIDIPALKQELATEREPDIKFEEWNFKGFGIHPSTIMVKVWKLYSKIFVLFIDIGKGTSVTNAAEQLVEEVFSYLSDTGLIGNPKEDFIFAETYQGKNEGVDLVIPEWKGGKVVDVEWCHLGILKNSL